MLCDGWLLRSAEAASPPPVANPQQHHLVYVYVSSQLGLILTYLQYLLDQF
jgi:hypothetical protein